MYYDRAGIEWPRPIPHVAYGGVARAPTKQNHTLALSAGIGQICRGHRKVDYCAWRLTDAHYFWKLGRQQLRLLSRGHINTSQQHQR